MRSALTLAVAGIALLTFSAGAQAQYEPNSVSGLIERVHEDLNRGYQTWHFSSGDRKRLNDAEHNLRDFAKKWERGRFDKGELDEAIGSVQHVLDRNHLQGRERAALDADVNQLRAMREAYDRHEIGYGRR